VCQEEDRRVSRGVWCHQSKHGKTGNWVHVVGRTPHLGWASLGLWKLPLAMRLLPPPWCFELAIVAATRHPLWSVAWTQCPCSWVLDDKRSIGGAKDQFITNYKHCYSAASYGCGIF